MRVRDTSDVLASCAAIAGDALAQRYAVMGRDCQEIGHSPHYIVLEFADAPINEYHLP